MLTIGQNTNQMNKFFHSIFKPVFKAGKEVTTNEFPRRNGIITKMGTDHAEVRIYNREKSGSSVEIFNVSNLTLRKS